MTVLLWAALLLAAASGSLAQPRTFPYCACDSVVSAPPYQWSLTNQSVPESGETRYCFGIKTTEYTGSESRSCTNYDLRKVEIDTERGCEGNVKDITVDGMPMSRSTQYWGDYGTVFKITRGHNEPLLKFEDLLGRVVQICYTLVNKCSTLETFCKGGLPCKAAFFDQSNRCCPQSTFYNATSPSSPSPVSATRPPMPSRSPMGRSPTPGRSPIVPSTSPSPSQSPSPEEDNGSPSPAQGSPSPSQSPSPEEDNGSPSPMRSPTPSRSPMGRSPTPSRSPMGRSPTPGRSPIVPSTSPSPSQSPSPEEDNGSPSPMQSRSPTPSRSPSPGSSTTPTPVSAGRPPAPPTPIGINAFPYHDCNRTALGPYSLSLPTTTRVDGENRYCFTLSAKEVQGSGRCTNYDLRKIEIGINTNCRTTAKDITVDGQSLASSFQSYTDLNAMVFKIGRPSSDENPLVKYDDLVGKSIQTCFTLPQGPCASLDTFCPDGACAATFFSLDDKCCPLTFF